MKPIVLYIDEEEMALHTMGRRLKRCFGDEVEVILLFPEQSIDVMMQKIASFHSLVSIVIDQKLFVAGTANYVGTELANVIRQTDLKMPIYILTNFVDDVDSNLGSIEYVLAKDDLSDNDRIDAISMRLRRHINVFQDVLLKREVRFEELLRKGYLESLSEDEKNEFESLRFHRERKIAISELLGGIELEKKIEGAQAIIAKISATLGK